MTDRTTDGTSKGVVDLSVRDGNPWEGVFSDAKSFGDTFTGPAGTDGDPIPETSQASEPVSSVSPPADPAPLAAKPGDDGVPAPSKDVVADPAKPAASEPDPLASAKPFTYPGENGEVKTIDGAYRLPGEGLYVPEDRVPHFEQLASRSDSLERQNRELDDRSKALERLTEWKHSGPDGKETILTGREAVEASRVALGHALAEVQMLRAIVDDPMKMAALLVHTGEGVFQHDPDRKALLGERLANLKGAVESSIRQQVGRMASAPPPPVPALSPEQIAERSLPTVDAVIANAKVAGLTTEDKQALARMVPRFTITVTPQNAAQYPQSRLGETVLDYTAFLPEVQDRAALRAQAIQAAQTGTTVSKFNTGMKQGAEAGKQPARQPSHPSPSNQRPSTTTRRDGAAANQLWTDLVAEAQSASL